tara:strand:+ start:3408 stop:3521 length:114 start_codon:yes stop_codon:yes gene_type:complete
MLDKIIRIGAKKKHRRMIGNACQKEKILDSNTLYKRI